MESTPEHTNELPGLMVTAIVGGAFLPPLAAILYVTGTAFAILKGASKTS